MNDEIISFFAQEVDREVAPGRQYTRLKWTPLSQTYSDVSITVEEGMRNLECYSTLRTRSRGTGYIPTNLTDTNTITRVSQAGTAKKGTTTVQKHLSEMSKEQLRNYVKNLKDNI